MIQKTILLIVLFSLLASSVVAAVQMKVVTPAFVVSDVPFLIGVQFHTGGQAIGSAQAAVKAANSPDTLAQFTGASQCSGCLDNNLLEIYSGTDNGKPARILKSNGKVGVTYTTNAFTQNFYTITAESVLGTGQSTRSEKIELVLGPTNTYMKDADGNSLAFEATPVVYESAYEVRKSTCGDGVVGYIDGNTVGIKDGDANETCDKGISALSGEPQGCSDDCSYIKSTHKIDGQISLAALPQCAFGSTSCTLKVLTAQERLLAKLNAIFNLPQSGQNCFPYAGHPEITSGGAGFCVAQKGIAFQIQPLLLALKEYYGIS